ncbi:hypothetical protein [Franconibacter helveticus]|uniref:hypothetical protein n=1 Tax=Franconibacter helveticus TaxID=357240 RepID=UPI000DA22C39|nr:hypothetical protein [Franconibacter helveticus]
MNKLIASKILYAPILLVFFGAPLFHDVIKYGEDYGIEEWMAIGGLYLIGFLIASPVLHLIFKVENSYLKMTFKVSICFGASLLLHLAALILFWSNSAYLYVSLAVAMLLTYFIMVVGRKNLKFPSRIFYDKDTGAMYRVAGHKVCRLTSDEAAKYQGVSASGIEIFNFSSGSMNGFDRCASEISLSNFSSAMPDFQNDSYINPSSGLPMTGGISGLDIHGNSWGTSFNEPSSNTSYDPNRGY